MNISEIKAKLGVTSIDFTRGMTQDGKATEWLKAWDNEKRVAIVAHQDVIAAAKTGSTSLIVKTEAKISTTNQQPYVQHVICVAKSIEVSL